MKRRNLFLAGLLCVALLAGCASQTANTSSDGAVKTETPDYSDVTVEPSKEFSDLNIQISNYGAELVDEMYKASNSNVVISNVSIDMALSMLLEGASGNTQRELEAYLGYSKEEAKDVNKAYIEEIESYKSDEVKINVANSFWAGVGAEINPDYVELLKDYFFAEAQSVNFKDEQTADIINEWCSDKTNGLIPKVVDEQSIKELAAMLINSVYFKGTWVNQYYDSVDGKFNGADTQVLISTEGTYFENDKAVGFAKPYYGGFEFIGILPKDEGEFSLSDLDIDGLLDSRTYEYDVLATIPKFKAEYSVSLKSILPQLGITDVFTDESNLSDIGDSFYVDDALHKTYISVDENGTEAAAITAVMVGATSVQEEREMKEVTLDRPFVFMIYDTTTNTALFTGKIVNLD